MQHLVKKIISGGQTGADRAALDFAINHSLHHEGWCPKGRKALDGPLDEKYHLIETPSSSYLQRTEWNVRDSDATIVFTLASTPTGGSLKTISFCTKHRKPCLHVSAKGVYQPEKAIIEFLNDHPIAKLNIAGSRESKEPGVYDWTMKMLERTLLENNGPTFLIGGADEG